MRIIRLCLFTLAAATLADAQPVAGRDAFSLRHGDRVVFYGDSITDQRLYTTFVETFVVTRFPERTISFVHSGWGGDRVSGGAGGPVDVRLQRDVIVYQPSVVTIMLGMNDGRYRAFDDSIFSDYSFGYEKLVTTLTRALPGVRLTLIQPSPYDDVTRPPGFAGGYNAVLVRYGEFLKTLAEREKAGWADLNSPVVAALKKADAADHETALRIVPDRVHPGPGGHLLMAAALLKAWEAPALVSEVALDAAAATIDRTGNTRISELAASSQGLVWVQVDNALPMPVNMRDAATALAVRSSDFVETLNRQMLRVINLTAGDYALKIDGEPVGKYAASELAAGVNLALLETPMARQAAGVHALTLKHNNIHNARWRSIQVPLAENAPEHLKSAMDELDALERDLIEQQRAAAQPQPRRYELERQ